MPTIQRLDRILQTEPNPYVSAYDLLYKAATAYFCDNNAFILIHRDNSENVTALYNLIPASVQFLQDSENGGKLYCKLTFKDGENVIIPYSDIIHLRRHFAKNELLGTDNAALFPALETAHAQTEGIKTAIQNGVTIRGVLQFTSIMNDEKLKEAKDRFVNDYLKISNSSGVVALDQKMDYTPITTSGAVIDQAQITAVQNQIYSYLNISAKMVSGEYSEDDFAALYESVIEPLALQMSLEYTRKIFTPRERAFDREIIFGGERLEFASAKTRISMLKELLPHGLLTINESRKILSLPEVPDGDKRLQSLNYVNAAKADVYQEIEGEEENANTDL
jgi:HK97 family phage portal protein